MRCGRDKGEDKKVLNIRLCVVLGVRLGLRYSYYVVRLRI